MLLRKHNVDLATKFGAGCWGHPSRAARQELGGKADIVKSSAPQAVEGLLVRALLPVKRR